MKEFKGKLGNYKIIETEDNTQTVYSEYFDEACHNLSGAYAETIHNYIQGCDIPAFFSQNNSFSVLDVGFGVGVGLKAMLDEQEKHPSFTEKVNYYSIEIDEDLFLWAVKQSSPDIVFTRKTSPGLIYYEGNKSAFTMRIFIGDGRKTLPEARSLGLLVDLDAVFQDPFSPKKNPTLWSVEWFGFLRSISAQHVRLATYSSSISIRKSLLRAGWAVINDHGFALKRTMTKANLTGVTSSELLEQLKRSPTSEIHDSEQS